MELQEAFKAVDWGTVLTVCAIVLIIALVYAIVSRAITAIIVIAIVLIVGPMLYNVTWGDGRETVGTFASFFRDKDVKEQIVSGYDDYYQREQEQGVLDTEKVSEYFSNIFIGSNGSENATPDTKN